jgi:hypothetical protein
MHNPFNSVRPHWIEWARPRDLYAAGRLLLVLASVTLIALPITQQVWTWDRFLHGGQDFETTVLLILTSLCLVLVMAKGFRQGLELFLSLWWSGFRFRRGPVLRPGLPHSAALLPERVPWDSCNPPLQI